MMTLPPEKSADIKRTKPWYDDYAIKGVVYSYIASHDILANREEFLSFIKSFKTSQGSSLGHPVYIFYFQKTGLNLEDKAEE